MFGEISQRPVKGGAAQLFARLWGEIEARVAHGLAAKWAITASANASGFSCCVFR